MKNKLAKISNIICIFDCFVTKDNDDGGDNHKDSGNTEGNRVAVLSTEAVHLKTHQKCVYMDDFWRKKSYLLYIKK